MPLGPIGVLLVQLGTPNSPEVADVRRYLAEFLADPRVLDMPAAVRRLFLHGVILRVRPRRSAEAYEKIWTRDGSPLTLHTQELADRLSPALGEGFRVAVGMRYQDPSIEAALTALEAAGCDRLVVMPLFPQYSSAATGSALEAALEEAGRRRNVPGISTVGAFHDNGGYIDALVAVTAPELSAFGPDHVLFSYHGLPESQVRKSDLAPGRCLVDPTCCDAMVAANRFCYRAQCFATTRAAAAGLGLAPGSFSTTFQSRLAGQRWIRPHTDRLLPELHANGVRRLAVLTPSFTADCLETLEEIGIRGRRQWEELGSEDFLLVPCLNAHPSWVKAVADLVRAAV